MPGGEVPEGEVPGGKCLETGGGSPAPKRAREEVSGSRCRLGSGFSKDWPPSTHSRAVLEPFPSTVSTNTVTQQLSKPAEPAFLLAGRFQHWHLISCAAWARLRIIGAVYKTANGVRACY